MNSHRLAIFAAHLQRPDDYQKTPLHDKIALTRTVLMAPTHIRHVYFPAWETFNWSLHHIATARLRARQGAHVINVTISKIKWEDSIKMIDNTCGPVASNSSSYFGNIVCIVYRSPYLKTNLFIFLIWEFFLPKMELMSSQPAHPLVFNAENVFFSTKPSDRSSFCAKNTYFRLLLQLYMIL